MSKEIALFIGRVKMPITLYEGDEVELKISLTPVPPKPAALYGKVTDAKTGAAINGALIKVGAVASGSSKTDGSFRIEGIPAGTYTITISHPDYTTKTY